MRHRAEQRFSLMRCAVQGCAAWRCAALCCAALCCETNLPCTPCSTGGFNPELRIASLQSCSAEINSDNFFSAVLRHTSVFIANEMQGCYILPGRVLTCTAVLCMCGRTLMYHASLFKTTGMVFLQHSVSL